MKKKKMFMKYLVSIFLKTIPHVHVLFYVGSSYNILTFCSPFFENKINTFPENIPVFGLNFSAALLSNSSTEYSGATFETKECVGSTWL